MSERERLGQALPDHEVGQVIGRGQFGVVWSARHLHLGRYVAVKRLDDEVAANPEHAARFRREARTLAQLDHRHVVAVHDYRETDGMRLLIMELLRGGTLADRRATGMPIETAIASTLAAASALHHVHRSGVLHRDIKPENLMFDETGVLKVTDFGLARGDAQRETAVELSHVGTFFGTPAYVAPEQAAAALAEGWPDVTEAADQYSLAAVLYESLSGQLTHDPKGGGVALCTRRLNEEARPLGALAPSVPAPIAAVVMRAVARDPRARYPSTEEFAVELARASSAALGPGWLERSAVGLREPGPILDAATTSAEHSLPDPPPSPPMPPSDGARPRRTSPLLAVAAVVVLLAGAVGAWFVLGRDDEPGADERAAPTTSLPEELPLEVTEQWSASTGGNVFSSPAVGDDVVVVGSDDGSLYGIDRATGSERWTYGTGGAVSSSPAITDGPEGPTAVVGSRDGSVHAVSVADGAPRWSTPLGFEIVSSPAVANGVAVVGADRLYGLGVADGAERWELATDGVVISSPAISDDLVVVGSEGGTLYGVGLDDGEQRWTADLGGAIQSSPRTADGTAFVGTLEGELHAVDLGDGSILWSTDLGSSLKSSPLPIGDSVVVGTDDGRLVAVGTDDGDQVWSWTGIREIDSSPAAGEGWLAVGSNDGNVYLVDPADGTELGRFETGGPVLSSPRVDGSTIYVGSYDDRIYALEAAARS